MEPILEAVQGTEEIVLIPGGHLSVLPMHAARKGTHNGYRYAMDNLRIRYAPSAAAVLSSRTAAGRPVGGGILAIQEPLPVNASRIPSTATEVAAALKHFPPGRRRARCHTSSP
jgi:hypothetical protein